MRCPDFSKEMWRDRVFDLPLCEEKIDEDVVRSIRDWPYSGFSIDNSVQIGSEDEEGMQRLISYISRCPFSLARMLKVTEDGHVIYRARKSECVRSPQPGDERLRKGMSRNFQLFDALAFLAEVTQHIPDKGQHLIHYFGWYSNKERGMRKKREPVVAKTPEAMSDGAGAGDGAFIKQRRMSWADTEATQAAPFTMVGSDAVAISPLGKLGEGTPHPRFYGTFPRYLGYYIRERKILPLPEALRRITPMPAAQYGVKERGFLKPGHFADVVVFDPETIIDHATFAQPHQYPAGIDQVIVNGAVVVAKGEHTGKLPVRIIRS